MVTVTQTESCDSFFGVALFLPLFILPYVTVFIRIRVPDGFLWDNKHGLSKSHRGSNDKTQRSAVHTNDRTSPQHEGSGPASPHLRCADTQQPSHSGDTHHGSQELYREMVKRVQIPASPNQLYCVPLTDSQQYGWLLTKNQGPEPWTQIKRFPRKNSEMTKFVKAMMRTDPDFSLF